MHLRVHRDRQEDKEKDMAYSDKLLDHYENPRNVGSFGSEPTLRGFS